MILSFGGGFLLDGRGIMIFLFKVGDGGVLMTEKKEFLAIIVIASYREMSCDVLMLAKAWSLGNQQLFDIP